MATRYDYIAEQCLLMYAGGEPNEDTTLDIREVLLMVEQQAAQIIKEDWYAAKNLDRNADGVNGSMLFTFKNYPLLPNTEGGYKTTPLPAALISLPNDRSFSAIRSKNGLSFNIVPASQLESYKYNRGLSKSGRVLACLRGSTIEVHIPKGSSTLIPDFVDIDLVTAYADETRFIDQAMESRIMANVMRLLALRRRADLNTTDGVDTSR